MEKRSKIIVALLAVIAIELAVFGGVIMVRGLNFEVEMVAGCAG